jgi:hypothetical protein
MDRFHLSGRSPSWRLLILFGAIVPGPAVLVVAGFFGWRAGVDRSPEFRGGNPLNLLVILFYGLIGSFLFILCALVILSVPVILLTIARHRKGARGGRVGG